MILLTSHQAAIAITNNQRKTKGRTTYLWRLQFYDSLQLYNLPILVCLSRFHEIFSPDQLRLLVAFFEEWVLTWGVCWAVVTSTLRTSRRTWRRTLEICLRVWTCPYTNKHLIISLTMTFCFQIMVPGALVVSITVNARDVQRCMSSISAEMSMIRSSVSIIARQLHLF
jgi:hypothetical protein